MEYICHFAIYVATAIIFFYLLLKQFILALNQQDQDHDEAYAMMYQTLVQTIADYWAIKFGNTPNIEQKTACLFAVGEGTQYINKMMGADRPGYSPPKTSRQLKQTTHIMTEQPLPANVVPLHIRAKSTLPE